VTVTRRRRVACTALLLGLAGCEDSASGFGAGFGRAIGLLLLLGLVLPATIIGLVVWLVTASRRRRK
jgi:hypothetical protein